MTYNIFKVILSYSLLLISIVLLILYIIYKNKKKHGLDKIIKDITISIDKVSKAQSSIQNNEDLPSLKNIVFELEYQNSYYHELKEKTNLVDLDALIILNEQTIKLFKELKSNDNSQNKLKKLENIEQKLIKMKEKLAYLSTLIR